MKEFLVFLVIAVLSGFGYVGYRYSSIPTTAELEDGKSVYAKRFPSSVCSLVASGFEGTVRATIYMHDGYVRRDERIVQGGSVTVGHIILTADDTRYEWLDGQSEGIVMENFRDITNWKEDQFVIGSAECAPWWLPDESLFVPPTLVNFSPPRSI